MSAMAIATSSEYSQAALDRRLLAAANTLRGPVDPADFKAYVFPLLFFKRISDTWDWERSRALEAFDGKEELADHPDNYRFVLPPGCRWDDALALHENVGAGLQQILDRIQEANPETLAGIFGDVQWANKEKLPEASLTNLLDVLSGLQLDPAGVSHDLLGNAYEYLLKNFADESGKKAGEFFTPRSVVRLLSEILDPQEEESAHDPTCGSGGMLVEMVNHVRENGGDPRTLKLSGQEISLTTAAIARMNLFIHDIEDFRILRGDTLREPRFRDARGALQRFDLVIANPPFSLTQWGHETWADDPFERSRWGRPPARSADLAFVEHMLSVMNPECGRLAVVMPQGVLSRGTEKQIRRNILQDGLLEAVIGLPQNLFYNTDLPACILVCRSAGAADRDGVLFVDGSGCFEKDGTRNRLRRKDIKTILAAYREGEHGVVPTSRVSRDDVEEQDWDLNIGLYIEGVAVEAVDSAQAVEDYLVARDALRDAEARLEERLRGASLIG
jgi:type I restriction enzyme M protein